MPPNIYAKMPMPCKALALKHFINAQVILNVPKKENNKTNFDYKCQGLLFNGKKSVRIR
jgi:hypothetical protein